MKGSESNHHFELQTSLLCVYSLTHLNILVLCSTHRPPSHAPPSQEVSIHRASFGSKHGLTEKGEILMKIKSLQSSWFIIREKTHSYRTVLSELLKSGTRPQPCYLFIWMTPEVSLSPFNVTLARMWPPVVGVSFIHLNLSFRFLLTQKKPNQTPTVQTINMTKKEKKIYFLCWNPIGL